MSTNYGTKSKLITASDILTISSGHFQTVESGNAENGGFFIKFYPTGAGCGAPTEMAIFIQLKEAIPNWSKLTYKFNWAGYSACWGFNAGGSHSSVNANGNIATFNTGLGDKYFKSKNCWELQPFASGTAYVATACNNQPDNPFHGSFRSGDFREFYTLRRRTAAGPAGPAMYLSCNGTGIPITISNIFIQ